MHHYLKLISPQIECPDWHLLKLRYLIGRESRALDTIDPMSTHAYQQLTVYNGDLIVKINIPGNNTRISRHHVLLSRLSRGADCFRLDVFENKNPVWLMPKGSDRVFNAHANYLYPGDRFIFGNSDAILELYDARPVDSSEPRTLTEKPDE